MARRFYAVQVGTDYSCDNGSTNKRKAFAMARREARENPGEEVRIAYCMTDDDFCDEEVIIQEESTLSKIRKLSGYTQSYLALKLGVDIERMRKMEAGKCKISARRAEKLAEIFGVNPKMFTKDGD